MKLTQILLLAVIIPLTGCDKDEKNPDTAKTSVFAGKHVTNMLFTEFNPQVQPVLTLDSTGYLFGSDSLDINADGSYDIIIEEQIWPDDSFPGGSTTEYPFALLTLKNNLCAVLKNETFPIGLGQTTTVTWIDTLLLNSRIDTTHVWSEPNAKHYLWVVPPATFWGSNGPWYNLTETERYIGLKLTTSSGTKYGWLKCYQKSRKEPVFVSCAIQK